MTSFFSVVMFAPGSFDLNTIWFILVGALFTGYVVLDGFDLGVGTLQLFAKSDDDRRRLINTIGPVWDGNAVWLVVGGGALFGAFPEVYASVFSGFYFAFILLLFGLIFRAVSIEFRNKRPESWWRQTWDVCFCAASVMCAFLIGVAMGNIVWGIPLDAEHDYVGTFFDLLHPYPILMGIATVALFAMHGSTYIVLKTEGELQEQARTWARKATIAFGCTYIAITTATLVFVPRMDQPFVNQPLLFALPICNVLAIVNTLRHIALRNEFHAFAYSCLSIIVLMAIFGIGMFPNLVISSGNAGSSLDIYNGASSQKGLTIMFIMACIGLPLVAAYTCAINWIFRGKVKLEPASY